MSSRCMRCGATIAGLTLAPYEDAICSGCIRSAREHAIATHAPSCDCGACEPSSEDCEAIGEAATHLDP